MGYFADELKIREADVERANISWPIIDATNPFLHGLEDSFDTVLGSLENLVIKRSNLGAAGIYLPKIDSDMLEALKCQAIKQEALPVIDSHMGVNFIENGSQVWRRLLFLTFKGTKLWSEVIEPHFNHILLGPILRGRKTEDVFVYDIDVEDQLFFGVPSSTKKIAGWIDSLMSRVDLNSKFSTNLWSLHAHISDEIRKSHGISRPDENLEEWERLYEYYWRLNESRLVTNEMREFMIGRTLVTISVDLPSVYSGQQMAEYFLSPKIKRYFVSQLKSGKLINSEYFTDPLLKHYANNMYSYLMSMSDVGGRQLTVESIGEYIQSYLNGITSKYTFIAAVRNEYLERV